MLSFSQQLHEISKSFQLLQSIKAHTVNITGCSGYWRLRIFIFSIQILSPMTQAKVTATDTESESTYRWLGLNGCVKQFLVHLCLTQGISTNDLNCLSIKTKLFFKIGLAGENLRSFGFSLFSLTSWPEEPWSSG